MAKGLLRQAEWAVGHSCRFPEFHSTKRPATSPQGQQQDVCDTEPKGPAVVLKVESSGR